MKKIYLLFVLVGSMMTAQAKEKKEPVVMTVSGKDVPLSEFIFMAKQGNGVDFKDKKSVREFVELYKIMKLKVVDAEAQTIHQLPRFEEELEKLSLQLQASYLNDQSGVDSVMQVIYKQMLNIPSVKHIYFRYPMELLKKQQGRVLTRDTVALYEIALAAWQRIQNGESFEETGLSLKNDSTISYWDSPYILPFQLPKTLNDYLFTMKPGDISIPVRSRLGFHLFQVDQFNPNPGKVKIAHILSEFPSIEPSEDEISEVRQKSETIYRKAMAGDDFAELAKTFSDDTINAQNGGLLPEIALGMDVFRSIETAAFALENIGDISKPIQSPIGFHILKLIDHNTSILFDEVAGSILEAMQKSDHFFDLYRSFEERTKVRHDFVLHTEAYEELQRLADEYFPLDSNFINRAMEMDKLLVHCDTFDWTQADFVHYLQIKPRSTHMYSLDFMQDVMNYFTHEIVTEMEKRSIERDYPEFNLTMQSYYDGTLLFEISNKRIWSRPPEEQDELEAEWVRELNEKYPVSINWKVINKIKNV